MEAPPRAHEGGSCTRGFVTESPLSDQLPPGKRGDREATIDRDHTWSPHMMVGPSSVDVIVSRAPTIV